MTLLRPISDNLAGGLNALTIWINPSAASFYYGTDNRRPVCFGISLLPKRRGPENCCRRP